MAVVVITMLVAGCGSSGAWSPEKKAELVEACVEPPELEEMTGEFNAVLSELAGDYGMPVEDFLKQRDAVFRSDLALCECLVSIYEKELTLEEFDSLEYAELERLAAKASTACL